MRFDCGVRRVRSIVRWRANRDRGMISKENINKLIYENLNIVNKIIVILNGYVTL